MIAGILLAAGRGSRFGGPKLLAPLADSGPGATVGGQSCANLVRAVSSVIAVVRPGDAALAAVFAALGATVAECPAADAGMGASLAFGVAATRDADGWVVALADMPWVRPATTAAIVGALAAGAPIAVPLHRGIRGHPVGFGRDFLPALLQLGGDHGARHLVDGARDRVRSIPIDDPGILRDVDVPADLRNGAPRWGA